MGELWAEWTRPGSVVQLATLAGLIASVSYGVVGGFVVARRITYIAAAIAHSVLGGIGFVVWLRGVMDWPWLSPMAGAVGAAILSALAIGALGIWFREREDTVISAVWAFGMSLGFLFLYLAPGFKGSLESYLLGSILYITPVDLVWMAALGVVVCLLCSMRYHQLVAVCFDEEFARLRGVNVPLHYLLLLIVTALSIVLLVQLAGIVMSIALIALPAATGLQFGRKLWQGMLVAIALAMVSNVTGIALSYTGEIPAGPSIVLVAVGLYAAGWVVVGLRARRAKSVPQKNRP